MLVQNALILSIILTDERRFWEQENRTGRQRMPVHLQDEFLLRELIRSDPEIGLRQEEPGPQLVTATILVQALTSIRLLMLTLNIGDRRRSRTPPYRRERPSARDSSDWRSRARSPPRARSPGRGRTPPRRYSPRREREDDRRERIRSPRRDERYASLCMGTLIGKTKFTQKKIKVSLRP